MYNNHVPIYRKDSLCLIAISMAPFQSRDWNIFYLDIQKVV